MEIFKPHQLIEDIRFLRAFTHLKLKHFVELQIFVNYNFEILIQQLIKRFIKLILSSLINKINKEKKHVLLPFIKFSFFQSKLLWKIMPSMPLHIRRQINKDQSRQNMEIKQKPHM